MPLRIVGRDGYFPSSVLISDGSALQVRFGFQAEASRTDDAQLHLELHFVFGWLRQLICNSLEYLQ